MFILTFLKLSGKVIMRHLKTFDDQPLTPKLSKIELSGIDSPVCSKKKIVLKIIKGPFKTNKLAPLC